MPVMLHLRKFFTGNSLRDDVPSDLEQLIAMNLKQNGSENEGSGPGFTSPPQRKHPNPQSAARVVRSLLPERRQDLPGGVSNKSLLPERRQDLPGGVSNKSSPWWLDMAISSEAPRRNPSRGRGDLRRGGSSVASSPYPEASRDRDGHQCWPEDSPRSMGAGSQ
jgi:hypothetical protein